MPNTSPGFSITLRRELRSFAATSRPTPRLDSHGGVLSSWDVDNVLALPGFFRGMLDARAHVITDGCLLAAVRASSDCVSGDEVNSRCIARSVVHGEVANAVAGAVRAAVTADTA